MPDRRFQAYMNVPALVQATLGDEEVAAHVPLKGEDAVFVTASRTLVYTAEGLLSDENVEEYSHDAEAIEVGEGRRTSKIWLDYGTAGREGVEVPAAKLDDVLHPVVAGVLNATGVTGPGETVKRTFRFSELTLVVTSDRVVKHIGEEVWGPDAEEVSFDAVTGIEAEEGSVSSQLVLETKTRTQRIKAPNEQFRAVKETVEEAVFAYHDAADAEEFAAMNVDEDTGAATEDVAFGGGVDPIDAGGVGESDDADTADAKEGNESAGADAEAASAQASARVAGERAEADVEAAEGDSDSDEFESSGFKTATAKVEPPIEPADLDAELDEMEAAVAELADVLERQQEVIESQRDVLEAQQQRLDALRSLVPEE